MSRCIGISGFRGRPPRSSRGRSDLVWGGRRGLGGDDDGVSDFRRSTPGSIGLLRYAMIVGPRAGALRYSAGTTSRRTMPRRCGGAWMERQPEGIRTLARRKGLEGPADPEPDRPGRGSLLVPHGIDEALHDHLRRKSRRFLMKSWILSEREAESFSHGERIEAMEDGPAAPRARVRVHNPLRRAIRAPGILRVCSASMPAGAAERSPSTGSRKLCVFPENPKRGIDSHLGAVILHDGKPASLWRS